jgi:hypothetical protein
VIADGDLPRDLSRLVVPLLGSLEATGDLFEPFRLVDAGGVVVVPAAEFFRELAACGRPAVTHRSYGMDLLRWWRFLWATGIGWDQAISAEARDFCCWIGLADKPVRPHWRYPGGGDRETRAMAAPGTLNHVSPAMRAALKAMLQERWEVSLNERARLSARSIVPVLDAVLAAHRKPATKIGAHLAPKIGHRTRRTQ